MIEQHVTSLEISKRLKELGVKQESQFYWVDFMGTVNLWDEEEKAQHKIMRVVQPSWSAFLASELGELLPKSISVSEMEYFIEILFDDEYESWWVNYSFLRTLIGYKVIHNEKSENLADCMGKMLIYLLENKLLVID